MMPDRLKCNKEAMEQMEYIRLIELILLPDYEDYEYRYDVNFVPATKEEKEKFAKSYSISLGETVCMSIFRQRYNDNKILCKSAYQAYLGHYTIQKLIQDLELDADKFWLLILFAYDYCESIYYDGVTMKSTPVEQLTELSKAISDAEDASMTLTFKAGKRKTIVDSPIAIKAIAEMIANYQKEVDEDYYKSLHKRDKADEAIMLKESPFIAFFARILLCFFNTQPQIREKRKKGANHSIKETDLVCQFIHFTKISKKECWTVLENETLKAYLKQYKNYKYSNNISTVYPEFSL